MALKNGMLLVFQSFKKDKVLRIFKLSSGQDDHAIMFMDDYLKQVCLSPGSALIGSLGDSNWSTNLISYISEQSHGEPSVLERVEADISLCSLPDEGIFLTSAALLEIRSHGELNPGLEECY